jgi:hypothetical protein
MASVHFSASYDLTTKTVSALACIVALGGAMLAHSVIVGCLLLFGVAMSYAYSPRGYVCSGRTLTVKRLIGDVEISLEELREARAAAKDDFRGGIRLWGSGGLFGYYGLFRTTRLGKCTWYLTSRSNAIVVVTAAKTVLLSPDDATSFLATVGAFVPAVKTAAEPLPLPSKKGVAIGAIAGVAVAVVALAFGVFAITYSPGPPSYTLTADGLTIHDLFYGVTLKAADIDVDRIRVVDFAADPEWRPTARTNGFSNSHYRSGWFRVANGEKVRMYRASGTRLILLPPKGQGAPVLLEVQDPERFVEEARRLWAR